MDRVATRATTMVRVRMSEPLEHVSKKLNDFFDRDML
jgi:hypothetical protein